MANNTNKALHTSILGQFDPISLRIYSYLLSILVTKQSWKHIVTVKVKENHTHESDDDTYIHTIISLNYNMIVNAFTSSGR